MLLLCALIAGGSSAWGQVTIWSEDFSGYSADAVPSGTISMPHTGTTLDASGTLSYSCANGTGTKPGTTAVKNDTYATGTSPEIMIGKKGSGTGAEGGKFTAVIPLDNISGTLTLTYYQNKNTLKVSSTTTGVSGGQTLKPDSEGQQTTTFTGITADMTSITIVFEATTTSNVRLDNIVLTGNKVAAGTTAAPTISGNTPFLSNTTVTITNAPSADGADIYYTLNGDDPTTTTSATCFAYTAPFTVEATTTVKAIAKHADDENASSVTSKTFTKVTPMTVTAALTAIDALANNGTIADQCVSGIVCTAGSLSSGAITYYISVDGTETNRLQVYKGKGLNNADFEAAGDIAVGDEVVIYGTLKKYKSGSTTTPEFDQGSFLLSKVTKPAPTFSLDIDEATLEAYTHETADATLTTNTDGEITCESSNADVATVALKSAGVYTITAQSEGSATITIRSAASANYKAAEVTVAVTVNDSRADAGLSFAEDDEEITWGDSFTGQDLTNTHSLAVTYSSTDETVATVNATSGVVSVLKAGSTTIKATFAGNATYKAAVASYTLIVNKAEAGISYSETSFDVELNDDSFEAPTLNNPNALEGITYASNNTTVATVNASTGALSLVTTAEGTVKITATFAGNDNYKSGSANYTINVIDPSRKGTKLNPYTVAEVIEMAPASTSTPASGQSDIYVMGYIVGEYRNPTAVNTTVLQSDFTTDANIAIADDPTTTALASSVPVNLTKTADTNSFGNKTNSGKTIGYKVLLKGDALKYFGMPGLKNIDEISAVSVPAKVTSAEYATFASPYNLNFSTTGITVYTATDETTYVKLHEITSGQVPANTPVVLYKDGADGTAINVPVVASADVVGENDLNVVGAGGLTGEDNIFVLSKKNDVVGFYLWDSSKTLNEGKIYLQGSAALARSFLGLGDDTTGIKSMNNEQLTIDNEAVYDLQGRKVAQPTKGLYIVNGKKVVKK